MGTGELQGAGTTQGIAELSQIASTVLRLGRGVVRRWWGTEDTMIFKRFLQTSCGLLWKFYGPDIGNIPGFKEFRRTTVILE